MMRRAIIVLGWLFVAALFGIIIWSAVTPPDAVRAALGIEVTE
jgi:hypothetical protein